VDIHYILGNEELLDNIKCLWEKLNEMHLKKSVNFKDFFSKHTFEARKKSLLAIAQKGQMLIVLAYEKDLLIGYCIASLVDEVGEINSLFVSENYRKCGIATHLMDTSLNWLKQNNPSKTVVKVSVGNETVFEFYARYGFSPRFTELEMVPE
jgi:ribosomal protein S18 acetylase RimI-like enzyme